MTQKKPCEDKSLVGLIKNMRKYFPKNLWGKILYILCVSLIIAFLLAIVGLAIFLILKLIEAILPLVIIAIVFVPWLIQALNAGGKV